MRRLRRLLISSVATVPKRQPVFTDPDGVAKARDASTKMAGEQNLIVGWGNSGIRGTMKYDAICQAVTFESSTAFRPHPRFRYCSHHLT